MTQVTVAVATFRRPADLAAHTLLRMEPDGGNQLQDWGLWLQAMKLADLRPAGVLHFSSYDQLISAAIAGQGVANPLALLLAAGLMLDHVGRQDLATRLRAGVEGTLRADGVRTRDLGGQATTAEFAQAVIRRIGRTGAG